MAIDPAGDLYVTGTTYSSDAGSTSDEFPASKPAAGIALSELSHARPFSSS
jgi:hypothetical protein